MDQRTPRDVVVSFRLTAWEAAHLDAAGKALRAPRTRSDFARAAALSAARQKAPPPARPIRHPARRKSGTDVKALAQVLGALGKVGNNVNQLARQAHRHAAMPTAAALQPLAADIATLKDMVAAALRGDGDDHQGE